MGNYPLVGSVYITNIQIINFILSMMLMVGLSLLVNRTMLGMAMRASKSNKEAVYLMGINGMRIKYFVEDDKGDPTEGANAYSKVIDQDKVSAIIGTVMSKIVLAGAPIAQNKGVPMVSPTATNLAVFGHHLCNCGIRAAGK